MPAGAHTSGSDVVTFHTTFYLNICFIKMQPTPNIQQFSSSIHLTSPLFVHYNKDIKKKNIGKVFFILIYTAFTHPIDQNEKRSFQPHAIIHFKHTIHK
jgi:membrane-anchored glycerophosphoryl diester phosphodiesterase (GDPDase)